MIIELITPLILATAPAAITIDDQLKYNHQTQQTEQVYKTGDKVTQYRQLTYNGTQTYNANGKPFDADND